MEDFKTKIKTYTWLPEENRDALLQLADQLSDEAKEKILTTLEKGNAEITATEKERDQKVLEALQAKLAELKKMKKTDLRQATKKVEEVTQSADDQAAEDLLKDL